MCVRSVQEESWRKISRENICVRIYVREKKKKKKSDLGRRDGRREKSEKLETGTGRALGKESVM